MPQKPRKTMGGEKTKRFFAACAAFLMATLGGTSAYGAEGAEYLTIEREVQGENISFVYRYPQVVKAETPQAQSILNTSFREYGEYEALEALRRSKSSSSPVKGELTFRVEHNTGELFSIAFINRGEDGVRRIHPFNLNGSTGRTVRVCDLFSDEEAQRTAGLLFGEYAREQKMPERLTEALCTLPNNQPYYLTGTQLVLVFDKGEFFDGEAGSLEFSVGREKLRGLFKEEYRN